MVNTYRLKELRLIRSIILSFLMVAGLSLHATETESKQDESVKKEYNAGEAIIEHIVDSYSWHILDYGEHSIAIPLPVILIDEGKFYFFSSAKFEHGHASYKGFEIAHAGKNKGKIIKANHDEHAEQQTPLDFSITKNVTAIFISLLIICFIFISVANSYKKRVGKAPKGLQSLVEPLILFIRDDIAKASIGKNHEKYVPFLLTIFFFILINNVLGLIPFFPGGANITGNIAVTGVLALFTFLITTFSANKQYWMHIVNTPGVPWWLKFPVPLMPVVELIGVFTKPFVLMVRLFANITAGHIIVLGFISLIFIFGNMNVALGYGVSIFSVAFATFMGFLELLVAFIQAYVFTLLSALYFGMATEEHH
ncbi:MAG: ATP synthase F0 subunit A [Bacteroidetes bacterium HGW-Bacteroidetes-17]|nr:MAG: ATP synthase F0 subunit A [Bacteroidetes bacterium HGW-Bacteroidetes-17]